MPKRADSVSTTSRTPLNLGTVEIPPAWNFLSTCIADAFACQVQGACMAPLILDGENVIVVPGLEPRRGDFLMLARKNGVVALKILDTDPHGVPLIPKPGTEIALAEFIVRQLDPEKRFRVYSEELEAVHVVVGVIGQERGARLLGRFVKAELAQGPESALARPRTQEGA